MTTEAAKKAWKTRRKLDPKRWGKRRKPQKLKLKTEKFEPNERNIIDKSQLLDTDLKKKNTSSSIQEKEEPQIQSGDHTT